MRRAVPALAGLLGAGVFALGVTRLDAHPAPRVSEEMLVVVPRAVQVLMTGGDRYLAANLAAIRAMVTSHDLPRDRYAVLAKVQRDVSWFNPAHEDNYYVAAALLPWNGEVEASDFILRRAADARPADPYPALLYGFNLYHFHKDPLAGAQWLRVRAPLMRQAGDRLGLESTAANWIQKGSTTAGAISMLRGMAEGSGHSSFRRFLLKRVARLENIARLEEAIARYRARTGRLPGSLGEIRRSGELRELPVDPFGQQYVIAADGRIAVQRPGKKP